jgi:hypothetical protein
MAKPKPKTTDQRAPVRAVVKMARKPRPKNPRGRQPGWDKERVPHYGS